MARAKAFPWTAIFFIRLICSGSPSFLDSQGPTFIKEPASRVDFSNTTGAKVECTAHGSPTPTVTWTSSDGKAIVSVVGTREVLKNGTLLFLPFQPSSFRQDVHSATYRCVASNSVGKIMSRDVRVRAVVLQDFDVHAVIAGSFIAGNNPSKGVIRGGTAMLKCQVPSSVRDFVAVTSWLQDSSFNIYPSHKGDGKYHMLPSGELLIMDIGESDKYHFYQCRAVNRLSGQTQVSLGQGVRIEIAEARSLSGPRPLDKQLTISARKDQQAILPCIIDGNPPPKIEWYREQDQVRILSNDDRILILDSDQILTLQHVQPEDAGKYICLANNSQGSDRIEIILIVTWPLSVSLQPSHSTIDMGERALLTCIHSMVQPYEVSITWLKNGHQLQISGRTSIDSQGTQLTIEQIQREDAGMYQCFVRTNDDSAQSTAEIRLGAAHPSLMYKFISQIIQPGPRISLKCTATGSPPPLLYWTLDGFPLPTSDRFVIGQYVTVHGDVTSHVNITNVMVEDGGTYQCAAHNRVGKETHSAELRIYGPPSIREMPNLSAVAGEHLYITCPVAGYPIENISWEKNKRKLPINRRQHVFPNGTLMVENVQRAADQGTYSCMAINKQGRSAYQSVDLIVIVPPRITPFSFQSDLHVGDRAGVQCFITKGDLPLEIIWQRDGKELSISTLAPGGIDVKRLSSYISSLSIDALQPEHAGNYTCVAKNSAATAQHSSQLLVNVPPRLGPFTFGDLIEGVRTQVQCVIQQGDPPLNLTWLKDDYPVPLELGIHIKNDDFSSTLLIPVVSLQHSGNYTCVARNQAKETKQSSTLVVSVPPRWVHEPRDENITLNQPVQFDCEAEGFPTPNIVWRKVIGKRPSEYQDLTIRSRGLQLYPNGTLLIHQTLREHQGNYLCEATNGIGAGLSSVVHLTVHVPPSFEIASSQKTVRRGNEVTLECEVRGDQPMSVTWQRDGGRIINHMEPRYHIKERDMKGGFVSELAISDTMKSDSGTYTCTAMNPFGRDSRALHLLVQDAPEQPQDVRIISAESRSARVGWLFQNEEQSPVLQFVVQYQLDEGAGTNGWDGSVLQSASVAGTAMVAVVAGLSPATSYRVRVYAENAQGPGEPSATVVVKTQSEQPNGPPQAVIVDPISSTELQVYWKVPPKMNWNGDILGYYVGNREAGGTRTINYNFTTVSVKVAELIMNSNSSYSITLEGLKKYRKYAIVVQAFNEKGPGPLSDEVIAQTKEDVPEMSPIDIKCQARSSQGLFINWQEPPPLFQNGIITGYKVAYETVEEHTPGIIDTEVKVTQELNTELHGLHKYANYSIQVWGFTQIGDGEKSSPQLCRTDEDVPEAPVDVKVIPASPNSLIVSWLPPKKPNGLIINYNVYTRIVDSGMEKNSMKKRIPASQMHFEFHDLRKRDDYEFWVTGSTKVGEGVSTPVIHSTVKSVVPAAIISFGTTMDVLRTDRCQLPCSVVGIPEPVTEWHGPKPKLNFERMKIEPNGTLTISNIQKKDEGNYTCSVKNENGSDKIVYYLKVHVPPNAPEIQVTAGSTTSLIVRWSVKETGGTAIRGYLLYYRLKGEMEWKSINISRTLDGFTLRNLQCGTEYQINIVATNRVGKGETSETVEARTQGARPKWPFPVEFVQPNSTAVVLYLNKWSDNGCKITSFQMWIQEKHTKEWTDVATITEHRDTYTVTSLWPSTHYTVRVTATNAAGTSSHTFPFLTRPPAGDIHRYQPGGDIEANLGVNKEYKISPLLWSAIIGACLFIFIPVDIYTYMTYACIYEDNKFDEVMSSFFMVTLAALGFIVVAVVFIGVMSVVCIINCRNLNCGRDKNTRNPPSPPETYNDEEIHHRVVEEMPTNQHDRSFNAFNNKLNNMNNFEEFYATRNKFPTGQNSLRGPLEMNRVPMESIQMQQYRQDNMMNKNLRSESEDYDSLGSDSDTEQRCNIQKEAENLRGRMPPPVMRGSNNTGGRRNNALNPAPESSTSTEPSPLPERHNAGPAQRLPVPRAQHPVGIHCSARRLVVGDGMLRSRPISENPQGESSFSTGNTFPVHLEPPTGFSDGHEVSEAECDIDTLRRIKLRQAMDARIQSRPLPRDPKLRNFTITV